MHKSSYFWGLLLVAGVLAGTILTGADRSGPGGAARPGGNGHTLRHLSLARAPANRSTPQGNPVAHVPPPAPPSPINISYQQAQPILAAVGDGLPAELKNHSPAELEAAWPGWVTRHDQETRARLSRGDEDTLVAFLVLGTSFTRQPRLTESDIAGLAAGPVPSPPRPESSTAPTIFSERVDDLLEGMANPGNNERLLFLSQLVKRQGYRPQEAYGAHPDLAERARLKQYVLADAARVFKEQADFRAKYEQAQQTNDRTEDYAEVSTLYHSRGVSLDASLLPNLAIEESLKAMQARGLLEPGGVRRVAVIGPGLDFTDKAGGYDFYPQQTLQCFALADTLFRLGLARRGNLELTTFDISARVNDHLGRARLNAQRGQAYVVQLPRDLLASWNASTVHYWQNFGDQIGAPVAPIPAPELAGSVETRAVEIRPDIVSLITPVDLNIVTQHLDLPPAGGFDVIIATNIFVYFDPFEQLLSVANTQGMLRPGGFLVSNTVLPLLPSGKMRVAGYLSVAYSDRPNDGDEMVLYQRSPD